MPITPVVDTDPVSPLENLFNTQGTALQAQLLYLTTADLASLHAITATAGLTYVVIEGGAIFVGNGTAFVQVTTARFSSVTARNTAYAKASGAYLVSGASALDTSSGVTQRYNGSAWRHSGSGLIPIIPTSVSASAGTATLGAGGTVTATAAASILLNGIFTSDFDNYTVKYDFSAITWATMNLRLAVSGAPITTATYDNSQSVAGASDTSTTADTDAIISTSGAASVRASGTIDIFGPALNESTLFEFRTQKVSASNGMTRTSGSAEQRATSSSDGLQFVPTGALLSTGTIRVYGWNNN